VPYKNRADARAQMRRYREAHPDRHIRSKYGLTGAEYDAMLIGQRGGCAICGEPPGSRKLAVDHCHTTGRVRGLLCTNCNKMIGHGRDSPELLEKGAEYVRATSRVR
jgi:hypothetical protein